MIYSIQDYKCLSELFDSSCISYNVKHKFIFPHCIINFFKLIVNNRIIYKCVPEECLKIEKFIVHYKIESLSFQSDTRFTKHFT